MYQISQSVFAAEEFENRGFTPFLDEVGETVRELLIRRNTYRKLCSVILEKGEHNTNTLLDIEDSYCMNMHYCNLLNTSWAWSMALLLLKMRVRSKSELPFLWHSKSYLLKVINPPSGFLSNWLVLNFQCCTNFSVLKCENDRCHGSLFIRVILSTTYGSRICGNMRLLMLMLMLMPKRQHMPCSLSHHNIVPHLKFN